MAQEEIFKLKAQVEGIETIKDARQAVKDISDAIKNTNDEGEKLRLAGLLGAAKAEAKDLAEEIRALDPGELGNQFARTGQIMAQGFAGAQAAAALFGGENEEIAKAMMKVQAIVQIGQGIQAVADAQKQAGILKNLVLIRLQQAEEKAGIVVTEGMTIAQRALNLAISATGGPIALLVIAFTSLAAVVGGLIFAFRDTKTEAQKLQEQYEALKAASENYQKVIASEIELMKAQGAGIDAINQKEEQAAKNKLDVAKAAAAAAKAREKAALDELNSVKSSVTGAIGNITSLGSAQKAATQKYVDAVKERIAAQADETVADNAFKTTKLNNAKEIADAQKKADEEKKKKDDEAAAQQKKKNEEYIHQRKELSTELNKIVHTESELQVAEMRQRLADFKKYNLGTEAEIKDFITIRLAQAFGAIKNIPAAIAKEFGIQMPTIVEPIVNTGKQAIGQIQGVIVETQQQTLDFSFSLLERMEIFTNKLNHFISRFNTDVTKSTLSATGSLLDAISGLSSRHAKRQKGLAIASATINTFQGATKALADLPPPANFIAAAAVILEGIKNVQKIASTDPEGGGGGIGGGSSAPPNIGQASNPNQFSLPQNNSTSINPNGTVQNQQPQSMNLNVTAFVVESEFTAAATNVQNIQTSSKH